MSAQQQTAPDGKTISAEALCLLTGLTDRRHRQIAKVGYFPPPIKSQYQLTATLQGMFKYYREMGERRNNRRDAIDEEKHRKLKLENDETSGRLTDTEKLADQVSASMLAFRDMIYAKVESEAPTAMCTLDVPSARIIGRRLADQLVLKIQSAFKSWAV